MKIDVYTEAGEKRTFAGAIEWPGWCRSGKGEQGALEALLTYGPRYQAALRDKGVSFSAPSGVSELRVVERLKGSTTTDFGAPDAAPTMDGDRLAAADVLRYERILGACWSCFDRAVEAASGKQLRTGPRGGGRDLQKMIGHVIGADKAYLSRLGWSFEGTSAAETLETHGQLRQAMLDGLNAAAHGKIEAEGPRGGKRWSARYFVRRVAWHVLDHAWELEDRLP